MGVRHSLIWQMPKMVKALPTVLQLIASAGRKTAWFAWVDNLSGRYSCARPLTKLPVQDARFTNAANVSLADKHSKTLTSRPAYVRTMLQLEPSDQYAMKGSSFFLYSNKISRMHLPVGKDLVCTSGVCAYSLFIGSLRIFPFHRGYCMLSTRRWVRSVGRALSVDLSPAGPFPETLRRRQNTGNCFGQGVGSVKAYAG